jgi:3-oxoacyl-(acyl-carrier-protein) synthase
MTIVISGIGAVSSLGSNVNDIWKSLINGKSGIKTLKKFNCSSYSTTSGAQINFENLRKVIPLRTQFDPSIQAALAAMDEAIQSAKLSIDEDDQTIGIVVGTSLGGNHSFLRVG